MSVSIPDLKPDLNQFLDSERASIERKEADDAFEAQAIADQEEEAQADAFARVRRAHPDLISGAAMLAKSYPTQRYLIGPSLLPKSGKMLLTAENGTGKSCLCLHIAACLITGRPLFGFTHLRKDQNYGKPVFPTTANNSVIYLDYETSEAIRTTERIIPLTKIFGERFVGNLFFPEHPSKYRLENGKGEGNYGSFDRLLKLIDETRPEVLVIDPLSSTHSLNENTAEIKQALNNIDRLVDNSGCAVILVHHESPKHLRDANGQMIQKNTKEKARGHSCLTDWADLHLSVEAEKQQGPQNQSDLKTLSLQWGKTRYSKIPTQRSIDFNLPAMEVIPKQ